MALACWYGKGNMVYILDGSSSNILASECSVNIHLIFIHCFFFFSSTTVLLLGPLARMECSDVAALFLAFSFNSLTSFAPIFLFSKDILCASV